MEIYKYEMIYNAIYIYIDLFGTTTEHVKYSLIDLCIIVVYKRGKHYRNACRS